MWRRFPRLTRCFLLSVFLHWPSPRNICGDVTRGGWATYSFHEFILRCLPEATVTVASFFSNRMAQCCKRSCLTRNLAPAYVRTSTGDEGIQRFGQPRAGPAHLQIHWGAARPGHDQRISRRRDLCQNRRKHSGTRCFYYSADLSAD